MRCQHPNDGVPDTLVARGDGVSGAMKRRDFLQRSGVFWAALGLNEVGIARFARSYYEALAAPTQRKLALLIGLDQYKDSPLYGCRTDVELQRELLIYRFGFQPTDILTLTNQQATRQAITAAYQQHLLAQAKAGDVVVFHFSGYGGMVHLPDGTTQPALVTSDNVVVTDDGLVVEDVLLETLSLLGRSLPTSNLTTILDTGYTYPGKSLVGNLRVRARPTPAPARISASALASREELFNSRSLGQQRVTALATEQALPIFPGVLLAATTPQHLATEARWEGFSAGLFTLALTQTLWQNSPPVALQFVMGRVRQEIEHYTSQEQQPQLLPAKLSQRPLTVGRSESTVPYHVSALSTPAADAVVTAVDAANKTVQLWLGGLPTAILEQYEADSLMVGVDREAALQVQLLHRSGLTAEAKVVSTALPQVGQPLREQVRLVPRGIGLTVALDNTLERYERVDAISALTGIPHISVATAGEEPSDYLFRKITQPAQIAASNLSGVTTGVTTQSSYGLFSPAQDVVPNTAGEKGEAVKVAIKRLLPKFQNLLAAKLLSLTENQGAAGLPVLARLAVQQGQEMVVVQQRSSGVDQADKVVNSSALSTGTDEEGLPAIAVGSQVCCRLENLADEPLYYLLFNFDSGGSLMIWSQPPEGILTLEDDTVSPVIPPGATCDLPNAPSLQWLVRKPVGFAEAYLLCSRKPFRQTFETLRSLLKASGSSAITSPLPNPLELAQAVLQDLHSASRPSLQNLAANHSYALDLANWAGLRFLYQVTG